MSGLLRYAILKNARDGSLITLLVAPTLMLVAPMLVVTLFDRSITRIPNEVVQFMPVMASALMAALAGFLGFRNEIANHSIGSFVLATRPWAVPLASAIYGCLVGVGSSLVAVGAFAVTHGVTPERPAQFLAGSVAVSLFTASAATTAVMLTRSMAAIGWVYVLMMIVLVPTDGLVAGTAPFFAAALGVAVVCTAVSTLLLERRCAA